MVLLKKEIPFKKLICVGMAAVVSTAVFARPFGGYRYDEDDTATDGDADFVFDDYDKPSYGYDSYASADEGYDVGGLFASGETVTAENTKVQRLYEQLATKSSTKFSSGILRILSALPRTPRI